MSRLALWVLLWFLGGASFAQSDDLDPLVQKGESLLTQKSYEAAIAALETVLSREPGHVRALNALLSAYDAYTRKLVDENRFDQAQIYIEKSQSILKKLNEVPSETQASRAQALANREAAAAKAYMRSVPNGGEDIITINSGREKYNAAVELFNKRQYEPARQLLEESISLDTQNPYAYELLGEIANLGHQLDEAKAYYEQAFALNPDPKLRAKYEKLLREKGIDAKQQEYSDEHFIIRYRRSDQFAGSEIREFLREAYRAVSQDLGHYPSYKVPVTLYDRTEYEQLMGSVPHWSGAMYDGKIRLPVYQGAVTEADLKKLIYHELTHSFVLDLSKMRCPIWLNEGLAQYQENKVRPVPLDLLDQAARAGALMDPQEIAAGDVSKWQDQNRARLFYLESFSMASELIGRYRWYGVKQLLLELAKEVPFEEAFEKAFSRTFRDFAGQWERDLLKRYGVKGTAGNRRN